MSLGRLGQVSLHVEGEVVGPREGPVAHDALEGLRPRVLSVVAGQLVRPGESPLTLGPVAFVRLLPCNTHTQTHRHTCATPARSPHLLLGGFQVTDYLETPARSTNPARCVKTRKLETERVGECLPRLASSQWKPVRMNEVNIL